MKSCVFSSSCCLTSLNLLGKTKYQVLLLDGGILTELGKLSFLLILLSHVSFLLFILFLGSLASGHEETGIGPNTGTEFLWGLLIMGLFNDDFFIKQ